MRREWFWYLFFFASNLPVKMYELLCVGLYGHLPWPSNCSISSNFSPDECFVGNDDASLSVDDEVSDATTALSKSPAAAMIKLSLVVDCPSNSNVSSSCDDSDGDELSELAGPFL